MILNFKASIAVTTPVDPGIFRQSVVTANAAIAVGTAVDFVSVAGMHQVVNGPFDHTVNQTGFFTGLPELGGDMSISVPVSISPFIDGGLIAVLSVLVGTQSLSLPDETASIDINLNLPDLPSSVTLSDGTPYRDVGGCYMFEPLVQTQAVPEPSGITLLALGFLGLVVFSRTRRSSTIG